MQRTLFDEVVIDDDGPSCAIDPERGRRRRCANRAQLGWGRVDLDAALPAAHPARAIVAVVERLDLRGLYGQVRARGETAGTPPIDPKILLSLWIYATSDGVGSGRELADLVELHAAYRWICGGVEVGYHRLNDFRSEEGAVFDQLVTQVLGRLMQRDLISLQRVAQDGTRVRASERAPARPHSGAARRWRRSWPRPARTSPRSRATRAPSTPPVAPRRSVAPPRTASRGSSRRSPNSPRSLRPSRRVGPRTRRRGCPRPIRTPA
ncbi:MAG: transposase [Proteobacteria bacterium]|nr:transposase [Pseudomonadota bacterium]